VSVNNTGEFNPSRTVYFGRTTMWK
jgi:hypothetical protein